MVQLIFCVTMMQLISCEMYACSLFSVLKRCSLFLILHNVLLISRIEYFSVTYAAVNNESNALKEKFVAGYVTRLALIFRLYTISGFVASACIWSPITGSIIQSSYSLHSTASHWRWSGPDIPVNCIVSSILYSR